MLLKYDANASLNHRASIQKQRRIYKLPTLVNGSLDRHPLNLILRSSPFTYMTPALPRDQYIVVLFLDSSTHFLFLIVV